MTPRLEAHDDLVQRLTEVTWALEVGEHAQAARAARAALALAQQLLAAGSGEPAPGDLRRDDAG
jgi:hypothetical protein